MKIICSLLTVYILISCSGTSHPAGSLVPEEPDIFPDYKGVTVPCNIAPLSFGLIDSISAAYAVFETVSGKKIEVKANDGQFAVSMRKWKALMADAVNNSLKITVLVLKDSEWIKYQPFSIFVSADPIDKYLVYRLIEPGYEIWNKMGIYQRCLENFDEDAIITNKEMGYNCLNCHSFCNRQPDRMLFHVRDKHACTLVIKGDTVEKLNTKTPQTVSPLVYPSWHPSGKYVAFSVNNTKQMFHTTDANRIEVFDFVSDVVIYDVDNHEIITSPLLSSATSFETFPTFSPDGKTLFFCTADSVSMPYEYTKVHYNLCAVSFDPVTRTFGSEVDTLYNVSADSVGNVRGRSVSFPRVSPDGNYLMFTLAEYGNFSIWHKDADLYMLNLRTREIYPLNELNSCETESYHSWSSNGRWVVFSSRRIDGLYTRPYITYIGSDGKCAKPFLLPQKDADFYHRFAKSFNIPELVTGKVRPSAYKLSRTAINEEGFQVGFADYK